MSIIDIIPRDISQLYENGYTTFLQISVETIAIILSEVVRRSISKISLVVFTFLFSMDCDLIEVSQVSHQI